MAPLFLCNIENLVLPRVEGSSKVQVRLQRLCGKDCELPWSIGVLEKVKTRILYFLLIQFAIFSVSERSAITSSASVFSSSFSG